MLAKYKCLKTQSFMQCFFIIINIFKQLLFFIILDNTITLPIIFLLYNLKFAFIFCFTFLLYNQRLFYRINKYHCERPKQTHVV